MTKRVLLVLTAMVSVVIIGFAQKKDINGEIIFQEATAREAFPNVAVFAFPQICDLAMQSEERVTYPPCEFNLSKDLSSMTNEELINLQTRALQEACHQSNADVIIEPLYTSTVYSKSNKSIQIVVSGYPAKYVNWRKLSPQDMEMIHTLYPNGVESIQKQNTGHVLTSSSTKQ